MNVYEKSAPHTNSKAKRIVYGSLRVQQIFSASTSRPQNQFRHRTHCGEIPLTPHLAASEVPWPDLRQLAANDGTMVLLIEDEPQTSPPHESSDTEVEDEYFPGAEVFGIQPTLIPLCDGALCTDGALVASTQCVETPRKRKRAVTKAVKRDHAIVKVKVINKCKRHIRRFRLDDQTKEFIEKHHSKHAMKHNIDPPYIASVKWFKATCLYGRAIKVFTNSVTAEGLRSYVRRMVQMCPHGAGSDWRGTRRGWPTLRG